MKTGLKPKQKRMKSMGDTASGCNRGQGGRRWHGGSFNASPI